MFTGLVEAVGKVVSIENRGGESRMSFASASIGLSDAQLGDSIAINGVCLTVVSKTDVQFAADVSAETLSCTTLGALKSGSHVNLERALLPTTRLGGHMVSGHVDGVAQVASIKPQGESIIIAFEVPPALSKYIASKGSICVDGVSLTTNVVSESSFEVNIIPHTQQHTIIGAYQQGTQVNIEVDVVARYLERLLQGGSVKSTSNISRELLASQGFVD
ncbi:Riboflavin synthase eubacterial/eukaryotic [hydrothermal vent metagenome]|uniref:Riboflavin synthase n=1 Tax=hydrothermal vent metagenome TaxID=652676 RepID=A0A3B0ZFB4_9ZZZZ